MSFREGVELAGRVLEGLGVLVLVVGTLLAMAVLGLRLLGRAEQRREAYRRTRERVARSILLGLEVLVAADIVTTVAIEPTFTSVGVLAVIVLIRTFLSWTIEIEIEGRWPWQRRAVASGGDTTAAAEGEP